MSKKKISLKPVKSMETLMEEKYVLSPVKQKIKKSLMLKRDHGVITLIWKMKNKMKLNPKSV